MNTVRNAFLPFFAILLTILGISYSACQETKADSNNGTPGAALRLQITQFEMAVSEMKKVHAEQVKMYGTEMGCNAESKVLELINHHNELIEHYTQRLDYHKLQLIQADTLNAERNKAQLAELQKDMDAIAIDSKEIRNGFTDVNPTHVTK